jgi:hypothetical protein
VTRGWGSEDSSLWLHGSLGEVGPTMTKPHLPQLKSGQGVGRVAEAVRVPAYKREALSSNYSTAKLKKKRVDKGSGM